MKQTGQIGTLVSAELVGKHTVTDASSTDDANVYDGAPVGVQIVGRKYDEEKVWAIGKILSNVLRASGTYQRSEQ